jgi:hypothetical protein
LTPTPSPTSRPLAGWLAPSPTGSCIWATRTFLIAWFGHVPLAVGPDGRRLAKHEGSIKLAILRAAGIDPRRLVGWIAQACGWSETIEPSVPHDWIGRFDLRAISKGPWIFTPEAVARLGDLSGVLRTPIFSFGQALPARLRGERQQSEADQEKARHGDDPDAEVEPRAEQAPDQEQDRREQAAEVEAEARTRRPEPGGEQLGEVDRVARVHPDDEEGHRGQERQGLRA